MNLLKKYSTNLALYTVRLKNDSLNREVHIKSIYMSDVNNTCKVINTNLSFPNNTPMMVA